MTDKPEKPDIVVPEESAGRGPFLSGVLRNDDFYCPDVFVQFERIVPHTRKSRIYLLLTAEQAKRLFAVHGPFTFEGSRCESDGVIETRVATDIWLKSISEMPRKEAVYWTQTSGSIGNLEVRTKFMPGLELDSRRDPHSAWFVARPCFALRILANQTKEEAEDSAKYGFYQQSVSLALTDAATASIQCYPYIPWRTFSRNTTLRGYSITVEGLKNPSTAKRDVDLLVLLASFASRERSVSSYWSYDTKEESLRSWQFNIGKFRKRYEREEPVVVRGRDECHTFLQLAFNRYLEASMHQPLLESAIYALLNDQTTLETDIARLFSGIQGALYFATQTSLDPQKRPRISVLYCKFLAVHPNIFDGLWPLIDRQEGPPLNDIRNAIVHGEAFSEQEWLALSYAGEHLRWHLERIILVALGWDVEKSSVSRKALGSFIAYQNWRQERDRLKNRTELHIEELR